MENIFLWEMLSKKCPCSTLVVNFGKTLIAQYREFYRRALYPAGPQDIRVDDESLLEKPPSTACFVYVYQYIYIGIFCYKNVMLDTL